MGRQGKEGRIIFPVSGPTGSVSPGHDCALSQGPWELTEKKKYIYIYINKTKGKEECTIIRRQQ